MTNVLNLIEGTPRNGRNSNLKIDDYKFEPITLDGELEQAILYEASCWVFVCTKVNVYDHEDEGKWETFVGEDKTLLKDAEGDLIVFNSQLVGFKFDDTIFFFPHGNYVGCNERYFSIKEGGRSEEYDKHTYSVRKIAPSKQEVYYLPKKGNPIAEVYGVDPFVESVNIQEGVFSVEDNAFKGCSKLKSIHLPSSLNEIIPKGGFNFEGCESLEGLTVAPENTIFETSGNCLISKNDRSLLCGANTCDLPTDGSVSIVEPFAFYRSKIKEIVIPEGITKIGEYAFSQSSLESVILPKSLEKVGMGAFGYCNGMKVYYKGTIM